MTMDQVSVMKVCIQIGIELEKSNNNTLFIKRELYRSQRIPYVKCEFLA